MKKHLSILGVLHIIFSSLTLLLAAVIMVLGLGFHVWSEIPILRGPLLNFLIGIASGLLLAALPGMIGGIGILNHWRWARMLLLVVAIFKLPGFPFDTALGIYTLWVLLNDRTVALLNPTPNPAPVRTDPTRGIDPQSS